MVLSASPPSSDYLILSCEHGGNRVPARFRSLFSSRFLDTHRGYDPGALELARDFARATRAPLFYSTVSRLLVELNRPLGHAQLFSRKVPAPARPELLKRYHAPFWRANSTSRSIASRRNCAASDAPPTSDCSSIRYNDPYD
jgi:predicted N-formylglutamate amidohydrolase